MSGTREDLFRDIWNKLREPFPSGSVEEKKADGKKFIPVQVYIHRLNEAAGIHFSWAINSTTVDSQSDVVIVSGTLQIVDSKRDGIGIANIQRSATNNSILKLKDTIRAAASDALRNACDLYEMGWRDLAHTREWGKNPGVGLAAMSRTQGTTVQVETSESCIKCKKVLTKEELSFLERNRITVKYCREDIPAHFLKNMR